MVIIYKERDAPSTPNEDNYFESLISLLVAMERKSRFEGDKSASFVVHDDATADVLLSIQMRFGPVLERWILRHVQCFQVHRWIRHKEYTLA